MDIQKWQKFENLCLKAQLSLSFIIHVMGRSKAHGSLILCLETHLFTKVMLKPQVGLKNEPLWIYGFTHIQTTHMKEHPDATYHLPVQLSCVSIPARPVPSLPAVWKGRPCEPTQTRHDGRCGPHSLPLHPHLHAPPRSRLESSNLPDKQTDSWARGYYSPGPTNVAHFFSPDPFPHPNTTFLVLDTVKTGCPNLVTQSLSMIISQNGPDLAMKTFFLEEHLPSPVLLHCEPISYWGWQQHFSVSSVTMSVAAVQLAAWWSQCNTLVTVFVFA